MVRKKQSEEVKQATEPNSDMTQVLELSHRELKFIRINMLRALLEKAVGKNEKKNLNKLWTLFDNNVSILVH